LRIFRAEVFEEGGLPSLAIMPSAGFKDRMACTALLVM
jgi:hypothetical protein